MDFKLKKKQSPFASFVHFVRIIDDKEINTLKIKLKAYDIDDSFVRTIFGWLLEDAGTRAGKVIYDNLEIAGQWKSKLSGLNPKISTEKARIKLEDTFIKEIKQNSPQKYEASQKCITFLRTAMAIDLMPLARHLQCQQTPSFANMQYAYKLGYLEGFLTILGTADPDIIHFERFKDLFHKLKSGKGINDNWDEKRSPLYAEIREPLELADKKWAGRDESNQVEMFKYLKNKFNLSEEACNLLKKELKSLAKKYGRLLGVKDYKKQK